MHGYSDRQTGRSTHLASGRCPLFGCLVRVLFLACAASSACALDWTGPPLGPALADMLVDEVRLQNSLFGCSWETGQGRLEPVRINSRLGKRFVNLGGAEPFRLVLADGRSIAASQFKLLERPRIETLTPHPHASILAERSPGKRVAARLESADLNLEVRWSATLRDWANTIRQEFVFVARTNPVAIEQIVLVDLPLDHTRVMGQVPGSPIVADNLFFGCEHPDSRSEVARRATSFLQAHIVLRPGQPLIETSIAGVAPPGQLRRGFLFYVEQERAHPYRPFLHYNAWYDICWGERKINERECLEVVDLFARELIRKRRVPMASFVWDDGWDDPRTLWRPLAENFPRGFAPLHAAVRQEHSHLGFWLSPFGGYGKPKEERLRMGQAAGFETGTNGFSLAGPNYFARFTETCSRFVDESGANFFKFDGLARGIEETEAMLRLTRILRAHKPDLFISITTGTWPSPFWLWYGDSTWRGGDDMGFHGAGSKREQWMTYRDMDTYRRIVSAAPLYPLNSIMSQGFAHARYGTASQLGSDSEEIRKELRSFFASGTCLQELYVTPSRMTARNWDDLAEAARWGSANADVLVDTHWVGGDPGLAQPYGWASWSRRKGILALRNPAAQPRSIAIEIGKAFELPSNASQVYRLTSPWKEDSGKARLLLRAREPVTIDLAPFEVRVFDASPL